LPGIAGHNGWVWWLAFAGATLFSADSWGRLTATDVSAIANPLPAAANVDGFDRVDGTHFYMSFSANSTVPGLGTVQDEDVVFYNAGTWSVYFDGTARGLTADAQDIDAISVPGQTLYFPTGRNPQHAAVAARPRMASVAR